MKAKWELEKEKWADCRKQSKLQKDENGKKIVLRGKKYWKFMYDCMTK